MSFVIDVVGGDHPLPPIEKPPKKNTLVSQLLKEYKNEKSTQLSNQTRMKKPNIINNFIEKTNWKSKTITESVVENKDVDKKEIEKILKKSVLTPEFEELHAVPPYEVTMKELRKKRMKERKLTKGDKWYGLPATEMTPEIRRDLQVLKMRSVLDPKRFYKKNDLKVLPKYFQVGKVLDSPLDYHSNRLTKKERKQTLVDELMADAAFNKYNKRKYKEIIEEKQKTHYKAWKQAKKLKKKK